MTANVSISLNKGVFYETHTAYRLALIHSTFSSNLQSELYVSHANTSTALPAPRTSFSDNITSRGKTAVAMKLSNVTFGYLCRVLYFNRQNLMLITPPNDQATSYGTY